MHGYTYMASGIGSWGKQNPMDEIFVPFNTPVCGAVELLKHRDQRHLGKVPTFSGVKRSPRHRVDVHSTKSRISDPGIFAYQGSLSQPLEFGRSRPPPSQPDPCKMPHAVKTWFTGKALIKVDE